MLKKLYCMHDDEDMPTMMESLLDEDPELRDKLEEVEENFCSEKLLEYFNLVDYICEKEDSNYVGDIPEVIKEENGVVFIKWASTLDNYDPEIVAYFIGDPILDEYALPFSWSEEILEDEEE